LDRSWRFKYSKRKFREQELWYSSFSFLGEILLLVQANTEQYNGTSWTEVNRFKYSEMQVLQDRDLANMLCFLEV
jgi:hypothetical protein